MNKLFMGECAFFWGAEQVDDLPPMDKPEVAFAGRSNVGKSSLINALTGRNSLVRTSRTPGQTRALNFFNIGDRFTLVDMPGYGYAKVSKKEMRNFQKLLRSYLRGRVPLRLACVLVDSRHGLKDSDREMLEMLSEAAVPARVILTKTDELKEEEKSKILEKIRDAIKTYGCAHPDPILTSSKDNLGVEELQEAIAETLGL